MLVSDIATDQVFVETDGRDEVASCPERLFFVETGYALDLFLHSCGRLSFQCLHDVGNGILGCGEKNEMDVVHLHVELDDFPVFPLHNILEHSAEFALHGLVIQYLATVLGRPDYVVFNIVKTV